MFDSCSAFEENIVPSVLAYGEPPKDSISALHDAVYFDEGDFDDDCDLDLDTAEPIVYPLLPNATLSTPPQTDKSLPQNIAPAQCVQQDDYIDLEFSPMPLVDSRLQMQEQHGGGPLGSSQPLPWSSSPVEHFQRPKTKAAPVVEEEVVKPKRKKARTLPWLVEKQMEKEVEVEAPKTTSGKNGAKTTSNKRVKKIPNGPMQWNDSFSNLEAGRKEARKRNAAIQQKRSISTTTDLEDIKSAKKRREPAAQVVLSDEQNRVIDLVMNSKQSVFFTGSAGMYCVADSQKVGTAINWGLQELGNRFCSGSSSRS